MKKIFLLVLFAILLWGGANAQTPAFPGAEGFGRYTTGGREGAVYYVNTLEDTNTGNADTREGSLRWCINQTGKRTILFKVSGTIFLTDGLNIRSGDVTIAGQSAPGDGICIADYPVIIGASNVIIRYIRFRMGDKHIANADGADGLGGRKCQNVIIDHCSISWSTDECASFYENAKFTLQWCLISESLNWSAHSKGPHGYGGIWGGYGASFHHNLMAHHQSRMPRFGVGTTATSDTMDVRNNVYFNYNGEGCYGGDAMHVNVVNNYYKPGPAFTKGYGKSGRILSTGMIQEEDSPVYGVWGTFFIDGNYVYGNAEATNNNWEYGVYNQFHSSVTKYVTAESKAYMRLSEPLNADVVTTHTAQNGYAKVLLYAGASLSRDEVDKRIVEEATNNKATFKGLSPNNTSPLPGILDSQSDLKPAGAGDDWSAWPELKQGEVPIDTDRDGIPDEWEKANGLNAYNAADARKYNPEGYTYLEVYLNSLVGEITQKQNEDAIPPLSFPAVKPDASFKEIQSVQCYDLQGKRVPENTLGFLIVKTIYADGSFSAEKIMRQ